MQQKNIRALILLLLQVNSQNSHNNIHVSYQANFATEAMHMASHARYNLNARYLKHSHNTPNLLESLCVDYVWIADTVKQNIIPCITNTKYFYVPIGEG